MLEKLHNHRGETHRCSVDADVKRDQSPTRGIPRFAAERFRVVFPKVPPVANQLAVLLGNFEENRHVPHARTGALSFYMRTYRSVDQRDKQVTPPWRDARVA